MQYFRVLNARQPIQAGGRSWNAEPLFLQGGTWIGVLVVNDDDQSLDELKESGLTEVITESQYTDLKKNGIRYSRAYSPTSEPIIPTMENPAEAVEVEEKPDDIEEVLVVEKVTKKSTPPDSLSDEKPKKTRKKS